MSLPQFIMFDLDGTLVDTAAEIAEAVNRTLEADHLPALPATQIRDWIGKGTAWLFGNALQAATGDSAVRESGRFAELYPRFLHTYAELTGLLSLPYPDANDVLGALRQAGCRLAVVTNKERALTLQLLQSQALVHHFEVIVAGGDAAAGKPSPLPLQLALQRAGVDPTQALFVGDSSNDVQAARAAGVSVWAFNHGYNHGQPILQAGPDAVIESFNELLTRLGLTQTEPLPL